MRFRHVMQMVLCTGFLSAAGAQEVQRAPTAKPGELAAALRAQAARLERGHASELFAALGSETEARRLKLSTEQVALAARLDWVARDVTRAWLLRGLDAPRLPPAAELGDRLGEPGEKLRQSVAAHSGAIVCEVVLTPGQNRRLAPVDKHAAARLAGRYGLLPSLNDKPPQWAIEFYTAIRGAAANLHDPRFPLSELFKILAAGLEGPAELSAEQVRLVGELDDVTRDVLRAWLLRDLGDRPQPRLDPPTQIMLDRLSDRAKQLRASVVAHAELIALEAVLSAEQAERARRALWRKRGVRALLDPELAARLKLSRRQREDLFDAIVDRDRLALDAKSTAAVANINAKLGKIAGLPNHADLATRAVEAQEAAVTTIAGLDSAVMEVLSPAQARLFYRLTETVAPTRPASDKRKARRAG